MLYNCSRRDLLRQCLARNAFSLHDDAHALVTMHLHDRRHCASAFDMRAGSAQRNTVRYSTWQLFLASAKRDVYTETAPGGYRFTGSSTSSPVDDRFSSPGVLPLWL